MTSLLHAALEAQRFFRKKRWRFCIIGGIAVLRWGEPRATQDIDFTLLTELRKEAVIIDAILDKFESRIPDARVFALQNRVVLCRASNGVSLDIALASSPYEMKIVERASKFAFAPQTALVTVSAEDLVVLKAIANRDQDWVDISGTIIRQGKRLKWDTIMPDLAELCELMEDTGPLERLKSLRKRK